MEQMAEHKVVKRKDEEEPKNCCEDVERPAKLQHHHELSLEILTEFESMWAEHLGRRKTSQRGIDLFNDKAGLIYRAPQREGPTDR